MVPEMHVIFLQHIFKAKKTELVFFLVQKKLGFLKKFFLWGWKLWRCTGRFLLSNPDQPNPGHTCRRREQTYQFTATPVDSRVVGGGDINHGLRQESAKIPTQRKCRNGNRNHLHR